MRAHPKNVAGYVPIAALGVQPEETASTVPTLVLWGALDSPESTRAHAYAKARCARQAGRRQAARQAGGQADMPAGRQTDSRQVDGQIDRETDGETDV